MATFAEAQLCPRCFQTGEVIKNTHGRGTKSVTVLCRNDKCPWYNTTWVIDVNPDGSVPEPKTNRPKSYPKLPDRTEKVQKMMDRQLDQETQSGGGELRGGI